MGSMLMNMAANMLGLGNAATPLGLRAMKDLETLNPRPGTATNAMCTFLAINTSSIQLIPVTAIGILVANKAANPTAIVGTSIMATFTAATCAVLTAKLLQKLPAFRLPPLVTAGADPAPAITVTRKRPQILPSRRWLKLPACNRSPGGGRLILGAFGLFFLWLFLRMAFPWMPGHVQSADGASQSAFVRIVDTVSKLSIPFLLSAFPLYAALRRVKVYEEFVDGAKEGFEVAIRIIPYLVAILVAIGMFRAAGGIDLLSKALAPAMPAIGFPSGSAASGADASVERQRHTGRVHGIGEDFRAGQPSGPHCRNDFRQHGNHVLRAGSLFRLGRNQANAAMRCWLD